MESTLDMLMVGLSHLANLPSSVLIPPPLISGTFSAPADSLVTFEVPGSGGFGPPADRDPETLRADLRNGYVSPAGAVRDYAVDAAFLTDARAQEKGS